MPSAPCEKPVNCTGLFSSMPAALIAARTDAADPLSSPAALTMLLVMSHGSVVVPGLKVTVPPTYTENRSGSPGTEYLSIITWGPGCPSSSCGTRCSRPW